MTFTKKTALFFALLILISSPILSEEIHDAALKGDLAKLKTLLENNPTLLEAGNENDKTPFHFAAQAGHYEIVEFLLSRGADLNARNAAGETPLHYAAAMGHAEIVELLIKKGARTDSGTFNGSTPFHYAALFGRTKIAEIFVNKNTSVDIRDKYGLTPLDAALNAGQNEVAHFLESKGALETPIQDPEVFQLSETIYSIVFPLGNQSNLGVSIGNSGIMLIDTGFSPRVIEKTKEILSKLGQGEIKYIINTHLHQDHVGGNEIAGESVPIINFPNLEKMATEGMIIKGRESIKGKTGKSFDLYYSMTFNGEEIRLIPSPGIHTDADLLVYFSDSGIVHMGDLLISQSFPSVGQNVWEYLEFLEKTLDVFPAGTQFICGHGKNLSHAELAAYRAMLKTAAEIVGTHMKNGKDIRQMRKDNILKEFEAWNTFIFELSTDYWINSVYNSLKD